MFGKVRLLTKVFVDWFLPNYCFSCDKPHSNKYEYLCDECWTYLSPAHGKYWQELLGQVGGAVRRPMLELTDEEKDEQAKWKAIEEQRMLKNLILSIKRNVTASHGWEGLVLYL